MVTEKNTSRVRTSDIVRVLAFFSFFASFYYTTLWFNRGGFDYRNEPYWNIKGFLNWGGIDYFIKLILCIPIWWLIFRKLKHLPLYKRLLLHAITLPLFVISWQRIYYIITESLGMFHLSDAAQVWDIYIPALFYILAFGILHAYTYFKEAQAKQKLEAELREAALKSELTALKAQLNPHFLYNVFNTINASIPAHMEETRQMISELSDLFRYQLQASKSETVPLRDELEFTRKYLSLEKARFQERLEIVMQVDESLLDNPIPPMLIQPIVENAVKHGIAPLIEGGKIVINIQENNGKMAVTVTDTGIGTKDKALLIGKGIGLTNTASRLNKMFNTSLHFSDSFPHGLTVNFAL